LISVLHGDDVRKSGGNHGDRVSRLTGDLLGVGSDGKSGIRPAPLDLATTLLRRAIRPWLLTWPSSISAQPGPEIQVFAADCVADESTNQVALFTDQHSQGPIEQIRYLSVHGIGTPDRLSSPGSGCCLPMIRKSCRCSSSSAKPLGPSLLSP